MYNTLVYIPSQKEKWKVKPYNTFHQKEICKSLYEEDDSLFIDIINTILQDCIHPSHNFYNLSLVDKILLLLKIRCVAAGSNVEFESETADKKKYTLDYNFYDIYIKINNLAVDIVPLNISLNNFEIECYIPSLSYEDNINNIFKNKENVSYEDIMIYFIKYIKINSTIYHLNDIQKEIQNQIINSLPVNIIEKIFKYIQDTIAKFNTINIYSVFDNKVPFTFLGNTYTDYCKFAVKDNLHSIYQTIFILNKYAHMSSDYIEKLTPIERDIYIANLRKENMKSTDETSISNSNIPIPQESLLDSIDDFKNAMGG